MSDLGSAADGAVKKLRSATRTDDQVEPAPLGCCALPFPRGFGSFSLRTASIKWRRQWAGIERAMNCANRNSAFRPQSNRWSIVVLANVERTHLCGSRNGDEGCITWQCSRSLAAHAHAQRSEQIRPIGTLMKPGLTKICAIDWAVLRTPEVRDDNADG